jgi:hypothetical protein
MSLTARYTWVCDYCGAAKAVDAVAGEPPALPARWHRLDALDICPVHRVSVEVGGGEGALPPEVAP